jgi:hypothetical protein
MATCVTSRCYWACTYFTHGTPLLESKKPKPFPIRAFFFEYACIRYFLTGGTLVQNLCVISATILGLHLSVVFRIHLLQVELRIHNTLFFRFWQINAICLQNEFDEPVV